MDVIVGVHGIAQQQTGRSQLLRDWVPALSDGVEAALGRASAPLLVDLAFYGRLFLPPSKGGVKGAVSTGNTLADVSDEEFADLQDGIAEAVTTQEVEAAKGLPPAMGTPAVPPPLQAVLRAIDA